MNNLLELLSDIIKNNFWFAPFFSLAAGLITSFSPCSLSSVPLIIGYVGGIDSNNPKKAFKLSIVFAIGSAITFTSLGVIATVLGQFIRFTGDWWYIFLSILLIIMVLQLWEIIQVIPRNNIFTKNNRRGILGALIAGILAGFFSSPCSTPVLIVILAIVSAEGSLIYGVLLLIFYSIGHSVLVVIAGTSVGAVSKIKKSANYKKTNDAIKLLFGVLILILAFYMFYLGI